MMATNGHRIISEAGSLANFLSSELITYNTCASLIRKLMVSVYYQGHRKMDIVRELKAIIGKIEALRTLDADEKYVAGLSAALEIIQGHIKQHEVKARISKLETELEALKGQLESDAAADNGQTTGKKRGRKPKALEAIQAELTA